MYNSPFPKLNPKVRYKTVLERAGFDVIYDKNKHHKNPLRTSKSTPSLKSRNKKKFDFSNKNFTNESIIESRKLSNDLNDVDSNCLSNSNINTSNDDSIFDFENNNNSSNSNIGSAANLTKVGHDDDDFLCYSNDESNDDTRDTSDLDNEMSNLKNHLPMGIRQPILDSNVKQDQNYQSQSNQQNDLVIDGIDSKLSNLPDSKGKVESDNDNISHSTSISMSPPENINVVSTNPSLNETPFHNDISEGTTFTETETSPLQHTRTDKINELIDQLNSSALPRENELTLNGKTKSSDPNLLSADENGKLKKSSYYLSGLNIDTEDIVSEPTRQSPSIKYNTGEGPCRACHKEITSNARFAKELTGQWHRECFRCVKCNRKFNRSNPCYILNDEPYCQMDYHIANNTICKICDIFIEGECLENDKHERFHVHCLTCFLCHEVIKNDYFICNDNIPICDKHDINQLMGEDGAENKQGSNEEQEHSTATVEKRRTRLLNL